MEITVKRLTPELITDYFDFFDNRAFTDHQEWSCCYCTMFHTNAEAEAEIDCVVTESDQNWELVGKTVKKFAKQYIECGKINGYLAYADGIAVGWCNANDKEVYQRFDYEEEVTEYLRSRGLEKIKAVTCYLVAPQYRGKGVATALLAAVIKDAEEAGYSAVEGYPRLHEEWKKFDYYGPLRLWEKAGFTQCGEIGKILLMRKNLSFTDKQQSSESN